MIVTNDEILSFINEFKKYHTLWLETCFTGGLCYWFAVILKERFNSAKIFYDPIDGHFITKINNKFYDITGEVRVKSYYIDWDSYGDDSHKERIKKYCINFK